MSEGTVLHVTSVPGGTPVPSLRLEVMALWAKTKVVVFTDDNGDAKLPYLPEGKYHYRVCSSHYKSVLGTIILTNKGVTKHIAVQKK